MTKVFQQSPEAQSTIETVEIKAVQDSPEAQNIKQVLKESHSALKSLKEKIVSEQDQQTKLKYQDQLSAYFMTLSKLSVLSGQDRELLQSLKHTLESHALISEAQLQQALDLLHIIENKAEQLTQIDQQRVRDSQQLIAQQSSQLNALKNTIPTLEEGQKKAIETIKTQLDKHRWSKWLSEPVISYMEDKYIHKKPVGKLRSWLVGGVAMTIAGWMLPKGLKEICDKIENLNLDQLSSFLQGGRIEKLESVVQNLGALGKEQYETLNAAMQQKMHQFFEKQFGKPFDRQKFAEVYVQWSEKRKSKINLKGTYEAAHNALQGQGEFNTLEEAFSMLMLPGAACRDFLVAMTKSDLISWSEMAIDGVLLPSGKTILQVWVNSVWLFGNGIKMLFGQMSSDDFIHYLRESNNRLDMDSKMAIWGVLYRRGGWFWKLAGHVGVATGEVMSTLFSARTGGDIGKMSAYLQGGVMGSYQKELQVFKQLEESLMGTKMLNELHSKSGTTVLDNIVEVSKKNLKLFDTVAHGTSFAEIERQLTQHGMQDILKNLKDRPSRGSNLAQIKKEAGNLITKNMEGALAGAEDAMDTWKKFHAGLKLPWAKATFERELITKMRDYSKLQGKLLQETEMFHHTKNFFRKFTKGSHLSSLVEFSDHTKLYIKDAKTAKEFFDNIKTIGKHSPEVLKTLLKGLPMIMIGKEIVDALADPNNNDPLSETVMSGLIIWRRLLDR